MSEAASPYRPRMTQAGLTPTHPVTAVDGFGDTREVQVAGELPLTLYVDGREIVTLMTLGAHPEALALRLPTHPTLHRGPRRDPLGTGNWDTEAVRVTTWNGLAGWDDKLRRRTVSHYGLRSGHGVQLHPRQSLPYPAARSENPAIPDLWGIGKHPPTQRGLSPGRHRSRLCPVLRHGGPAVRGGRGPPQAADAIAGYMWLDRIAGGDMLFYTTGRLTSEIVMKVDRWGSRYSCPAPASPTWAWSSPRNSESPWSRGPKAAISWFTTAPATSSSIVHHGKNSP